jgi:hypothetical protein
MVVVHGDHMTELRYEVNKQQKHELGHKLNYGL